MVVEFCSVPQMAPRASFGVRMGGIDAEIHEEYKHPPQLMYEKHVFFSGRGGAAAPQDKALGRGSAGGKPGGGR